MMTIALAGFFVAVMVLCVSAAGAAGGELYVSPAGDDAGPGTKERPLRSLAGARDAVRAMKAKTPGPVRVWFAGGTYPISQTVVFGLADSAAAGSTITYSAIPGERPVFSGGVKIGGWHKCTEDLPGLPIVAQGHVWAAPLPAGVRRFNSLFQGLGRLPRAEAPGFTPPPRPDAAADPDRDYYEIAFPPTAMGHYRNLADVEVSVIPWAPWSMNVLPLESVDEARRVARVAVRASYPLTRPMFGKFFFGSVFVENVFEGLTGPGRWVLDSRAGRIYLWPALAAAPTDEVIAPQLTELIRIEGRIDADGPADVPVKGLVFRGLTFAHADRYVWSKDHQGLGLQHDWEMYDAPTAMVRLRGAEDCRIEGCRFTASAASAVRMDLHCRRNAVRSSLIEHVGGVGVLLAGYGPGAKDVNGFNEVVGNHIHHVGESLWHSAAVFAWQSGDNRIAGNLIHNTPYTAIVVSGRIGYDRPGKGECSRTVRWKDLDAAYGKDADVAALPWDRREPLLHARRNIVEDNEIRDVMEVIEDGDGIYVSGAGRGNVIRRNYIHHCTSIHMAEGIRCDDDQHDTVVDSNILFRIGGLATCIAIKGVTQVTNNIMACPTATPYCGLLSLEHVPIDGSVIQRNIFLTTRKDCRAVRQGKTIYNTLAWLKDTRADSNLYFNTADPEWGPAHLTAERAHGIEGASLAADPEFLDVEQGDFRLKPTSPALKLGFVPIDMSRIGLKNKVGPPAIEP
ncbi:MAG: right-handed parallel beta-helix repeat-containing protein [Planctomycetota bacterium]|nr:right-handed parallel beta-helix repeat-containing protein [Planctomycetota bacterium]